MTTRFLIWDDDEKAVIELGGETKWFDLGVNHIGRYVVDLKGDDPLTRYGQFFRTDKGVIIWGPEDDWRKYPDCFPPEFRTALLLLGVQ